MYSKTMKRTMRSILMNGFGLNVSVRSRKVSGVATRRSLPRCFWLVTDVTVGGILGAGGKFVGNVVEDVTNNLSRSAKGTLGEAITEIKYGAQGYKSAGKAEVLTGGRTATGKPAKAIYDHKMTNVFTGKKLTVESKFNGSKLTPKPYST